MARPPHSTRQGGRQVQAGAPQQEGRQAEELTDLASSDAEENYDLKTVLQEDDPLDQIISDVDQCELPGINPNKGGEKRIEEASVQLQ